MRRFVDDAGATAAAFSTKTRIVGAALMAVSGWFVAFLALGIVPLVLLGDPWLLAGWVLLVVVVGAVDAMLAGWWSELLALRKSSEPSAAEQRP